MEKCFLSESACWSEYMNIYNFFKKCMPKIRRGKEELHVLLRALADNMDYRGGGAYRSS